MNPSVDMSPIIQGAFASHHLSAPSVLASVTVDFDKSVFLQMALFALLILALKPLLFDPMLKVFTLREERTDGAKAEARSMQERAAEILSNYEAEVAKVRADATLERDKLRKETAEVEAKILAEARQRAEKVSEQGQTQIAEELSKLQGDLNGRAVLLSAQIAGKVLGRELSS